MDVQRFIAVRRNGGVHTKAELAEFAKAAGAGQIPDYQLAAWLMAAYLRPLNADETAWLTIGMADSGARLDLAGLPKPWVDKHSTGGVGDKTSIALLPILAACGLTLVKMSGRGLGLTGGTVDKLASVPGFRSNLSPDEMKEQARVCGIGFSGQTPDLAPADKILYALRDATCTIESIPLIVSSILSKKIAGGAEVIVLDVKCGSGAFMKDIAQARALAKALMETGRRCGLKVHAEVSDMDIPLGRAVGNALEIREAMETLNGLTGRFTDLCVKLAAETLVAAGKAPNKPEGERLARLAIASGAASRKAREWFRAQGGDPAVVEDVSLLPTSAHVMRVQAEEKVSGYVEHIDAAKIGQLVLEMGGGRRTKEDVIDPTVGVWILRHVGERVDGPLIELHLRNSEPRAGEFAERALDAFTVSVAKPKRRPLFL